MRFVEVLHDLLLGLTHGVVPVPRVMSRTSRLGVRVASTQRRRGHVRDRAQRSGVGDGTGGCVGRPRHVTCERRDGVRRGAPRSLTRGRPTGGHPMQATIHAGRRVALALALLLALAGALATSEPATAHAGSHDSDHAATAGSARQATLHDGMRKLWEQHVAWTRLTIVSFARTPRTFRPRRRGCCATRPTSETRSSRTTGALPATNSPGCSESTSRAPSPCCRRRRPAIPPRSRPRRARGTRTDVGFADFLNAANPRNWPRATLRSMMRTHLDQTIQEAVAQLTGDYAASVRCKTRSRTTSSPWRTRSRAASSRSSRAASAEAEAPPRRAAGTSTNGRGGFRTCDLSRVKRALSH